MPASQQRMVGYDELVASGLVTEHDPDFEQRLGLDSVAARAEA